MRCGFDGVRTVSGEDFETLDFRIERSRGQPEFVAAPDGPRDLSITFLYCGFDDFLLLSSEDTIKRGHAATGMSECPRPRQPRKMYQGELAYYIRLAKQRNVEKLDLLLFQFAKAGKST
jgi:hypothetical protein